MGLSGSLSPRGRGGAKRWDDGGWTIEMLRRTLLDRARGSLTLLFSVTVPLILIPSPPFPFLLPADWSGDGLTETREEEEEEEEDRTNEVIRDRGRESTAADGVEKMKGNRIRNSPPLVFPSFSDFPPPFPDLFFPTPLRRSFRKPSLPSFPPLLPPFSIFYLTAVPRLVCCLTRGDCFPFPLALTDPLNKYGQVQH